MAKKKAMTEGRLLAIRHFRHEGWTVHELASYKADMMDPAEYWLEKAIDRAINKAAWKARNMTVPEAVKNYGPRPKGAK